MKLIKYFSTCILLFFSIQLCYSETDGSLNQTDENGLKQGKWLIYFSPFWQELPDTNKAEFYREVTYKDGKVDGVVKDYWISGELQNEYTTLPDYIDVINGKNTYYYKNGQKQRECIFQNGQPYDDCNAWFEDGRRDTITEQYFEAIVTMNMGDYETAIDILNSCLASIDKYYGGEHFTQCEILTNIASLFQQQSKHGEAIEYLEKCKAIYEKKNVTEKPEYYENLSVLGLQYYYSGDFRKAEELLIICKEFYQKHGVTNAQLYSPIINNLGLVYSAKGDFIKAEQMFRQALSILEGQFGKNNQRYLRSLLNLAFMLNNQMRIKEVSVIMDEAGQISKNVYGENHPEYAYYQVHQASNYLQLEELNKVLPLLDHAIEVYKFTVGEKNEHISTAYTTKGEYYFKKEQYDSARTYFKLALSILEEVNGKNHPGYIKNMTKIANTLSKQYKYEEAKELLKEALELAEENYGDTSHNYITVLVELAYIYRLTERFDDAKELTVDAIEKLEGGDSISQDQLPLCYSMMATQYLLFSDYLNARKYVEKSIKFIKDNYKLDSAAIYRYLSNQVQTRAKIDINLGKYDEVETELRRLIDIETKANGPDTWLVLEYKLALANLYNKSCRFNDGFMILDTCLTIARDLYGRSHFKYARTINEMAIVYTESGKLHEAEKLMLDAERIFLDSKGKDNLGYSTILHNLANIYERLAQFDKAKIYYEEALKIIENKIGKKNEQYLMSLLNYSVLLRNMKDYDNAAKCFLLLLDLAEQMDIKETLEYSVILDEYVLYCMKIDQIDKAKESQQKSFAIIEDLFDEDHPQYQIASVKNLIYNYRINGSPENYEKANTKVRQVLEMKNSIDIFKSGICEDMATISYFHSHCAEADEYFDIAWKYYFSDINRLLPLMSAKEKNQYMGTESALSEVYYNFVLTYKDTLKKLPEKLYDLTLKSKGMLLQSGRKSISKARAMSHILKKWQTTRELWLKMLQAPEIAKKNGIDIDSLEQKSQEYEKLISSQSISDDQEPNFTDSKSLQRSLAKDEAAVEIIRMRTDENNTKDSIYYVALILKGGPEYNLEMVVLDNGSKLEYKFTKEYSDVLNNHFRGMLDIGYSDAFLRRLYYQYWQKIGEKLQGIKKIFFSPDGVYHKLNINTLVNPESGKYLLNEYDIYFVTSTRDVPDNSKIRGRDFNINDANQAILIGNPSFKVKEHNNPEGVRAGITAITGERSAFASLYRSGIAPLPGTEKEIKQIGDELEAKKWAVSLLSGAGATEDNVKKIEGPALLHLATHGIFLHDENQKGAETFGISQKVYTENPLLRSMILLTGAENTVACLSDKSEECEDSKMAEDGILTAYEAMNLDLYNTELVVLSACETGLGRTQNGEGVYGFQRAFQLAGARTIVMSLWKVNDEATQLLMTKFYDNWLSGQAKRQAFSNAQKELMGNYPHPYYWGAFIMVGE